MATAEALMREKTPSKTAIKEADEALRKAGLPDIVTFSDAPCSEQVAQAEVQVIPRRVRPSRGAERSFV